MGELFTDAAYPINRNRSSKRIVINGNNKITYLKSVDYFLTDAVEGAAIVLYLRKGHLPDFVLNISITLSLTGMNAMA